MSLGAGRLPIAALKLSFPSGWKQGFLFLAFLTSAQGAPAVGFGLAATVTLRGAL